MSWIIIITYNALPWIGKCIESCPNLPIVVVDNGSSDTTVNFIKTNFPSIYLLCQENNLGFGQANNLGISYALKQGADYVFLLNQDTYLQNGCIESLIEVHKLNTDFGIVSPIHLNGAGTRLDKNFSNYVSYEKCPDFYSDFVLIKPLPEVYEVPFVNAAGWLLSREILENVGGFDPIFFHYGEDDNYCQRAKYHGFKIGVVPTAFLKHDRENRVAQTKRGSNEYFEKMERRLKTQFADINVENILDLEKMANQRKKALRKAYFKFNIQLVNRLRKEKLIISRLILEIKKSRSNNILKKPTYLEI